MTRLALRRLRMFYESVDVSASALLATSTHEGTLACKRGCAGCCIDGIKISPLEADYILQCADHSEIVRRKAAARAPAEPTVAASLDDFVREGGGRCAFLADDNSCSVYEHRPFVCRHMGLPLRWVEGCDELEGGGNITHEGRDICPLNDESLLKPVEDMAAEHCYSVDEVWAELDKLGLEATEGSGGGTGGMAARDEGNEAEVAVALRDLFDQIAKRQDSSGGASTGIVPS
jgi:Fe-S-cluster containining protein